MIPTNPAARPAYGASCAVLLLLACLCAPSCRPAVQPRNVLLISVDTLRADHLGCYGYDRPTSPFLDGLAAEGVRFSRAFSAASWTLPAHMSMLTSRYPHVHGAERENQALRDGIPTLAGSLSRQGVFTGAFISWFYLAARYGFDRGFDDFVELLPAEEDLAASRKAEDVVDHAIAWLEEHGRGAQPFFLFVHLFDPHIDYSPPVPYDRLFQGDEESGIDGTYASLEPYIKGLHQEPRRIDRRDLDRAVSLYDGEIRYTDTEIGRLLGAVDELPGGSETLVIVTSDHGEELDDHGSMEGHQWTLYDEVLHVPLIVRWPGGVQGQVVEDLVETLDIAPTVLDWLDLEPLEGSQGRSLLPAMQGATLAGERLVYSKIEQFNSKQAVRSATHKLIHTFDTGTNAFGLPIRPGYEFYDLRTDPREQVNIYSEDAAIAARLRKALFAWLATGEAVGPAGEVTFTEEERRRLRALGYVQ